MVAIDFIKSISLFLGAMENISNFFFFNFDVKWIKYKLQMNKKITIRLSWTRIISASPELISLALSGRILIATVIFDYYYSIFGLFFYILFFKYILALYLFLYYINISHFITHTTTTPFYSFSRHPPF